MNSTSIHLKRRTASAAVLATVALAASGCIPATITADTSCEKFMQASPTEQDAAVSKVASELHAGNAVTPLGRPNINYLCANSPSRTLGDAVRATG